MKKKTIWIIVALVILAIAMYIILAPKKAAAMVDTAGSGGSGSGSGSGSKPADSSTMPLKEGSRGPLVSDIQRALNERFAKNIEIDGIWGPHTTLALKSAGFPVVIFWKQYAEITGKELNITGGAASGKSKLPWPLNLL